MRSGKRSRSFLVREAMHNELRHEVQVGARIDIVRDAGGDDAEDGRGALAADIAPREEPIFATETKPSQLTLPAIIRDLDIAIFEEQGEAWPLAVEIAESATERSLGWNEPAVLVARP